MQKSSFCGQICFFRKRNNFFLNLGKRLFIRQNDRLLSKKPSQIGLFGQVSIHIGWGHTPGPGEVVKWNFSAKKGANFVTCFMKWHRHCHLHHMTLWANPYDLACIQRPVEIEVCHSRKGRRFHTKNEDFQGLSLPYHRFLWPYHVSDVTVFCWIHPMFGPVKGYLSRQYAMFEASTAER